MRYNRKSSLRQIDLFNSNLIGEYKDLSNLVLSIRKHGMNSTVAEYLRLSGYRSPQGATESFNSDATVVALEGILDSIKKIFSSSSSNPIADFHKTFTKLKSAIHDRETRLHREFAAALKLWSSATQTAFDKVKNDNLDDNPYDVGDAAFDIAPAKQFISISVINYPEYKIVSKSKIPNDNYVEWTNKLNKAVIDGEAKHNNPSYAEHVSRTLYRCGITSPEVMVNLLKESDKRVDFAHILSDIEQIISNDLKLISASDEHQARSQILININVRYNALRTLLENYIDGFTIIADNAYSLGNYVLHPDEYKDDV